MFRRKTSSNVGKNIYLPRSEPELGEKAPRKERALGTTTQRRAKHSGRKRPRVVGAFLLLVTLSVVAFWFSCKKLPTVYKQEVEAFQCPNGGPSGGDNFDPDRFKNAYLGEDNARDLEEFMKDFREKPYDDWQLTYNHMKKGLTPFKKKYYPSNVKSGDTIYESACGIGMNTLMTLEIVQEVNGVQPLTIHGNEYLEESTAKANVFLDRLVPEGVSKGNICAADSTKLDYVPSNSMDLVFTGYISPIIDPLSFNEPLDPHGRNHGRYNDMCKSDSWKDQKLSEVAQNYQEDFYGKWVSEMFRITKPGKPVIVEHVSQPKCVHPADWGGVSKDFWKRGIQKYNWPVQPDSIEMEDDHIYTMQRYHVFMRKSNQ